MGSFSELYVQEQARKDSELRDLRLLVAALVDKAGGSVTLKRSKLEAYAMDPVSSHRMPVEILIDDKYDSVTIRTRAAGPSAHG